MGRKTLESLPNGDPLPDRVNVVISRDDSFEKWDEYREKNIILFNLEEFLRIHDGTKNDLSDVYIIGGGQIYKQILPYVNEVLVTKIEGEFKADTYFPNLDKQPEWEITEESEIMEENGYKFKYVTYSRVSG